MAKRTVSALLYTVPEVQEILRCGRSKVYELGGAGKIQFVKSGKSSRVVADSVHKYVQNLIAEAQGVLAAQDTGSIAAE